MNLPNFPGFKTLPDSEKKRIIDEFKALQVTILYMRCYKVIDDHEKLLTKTFRVLKTADEYPEIEKFAKKYADVYPNISIVEPSGRILTRGD